MVVFPLPSRPVSIVMATFGVWSNFNFSEQFLSIKYRFRDYIKHEEVNDFMGKLQFVNFSNFHQPFEPITFNFATLHRLKTAFKRA